MKILIIAEKPSVAKKIAFALQRNPAKNKGYYEDENYIVSNCYGHLFELKKPNEINEKYSSWNINNLPMQFDKIPFKVKNDKGIKEQIKILTTLLNRDDVSEVVNACDADREGELIFRNIYLYSKTKKPASRMWIESMADNKVIYETFKSRIKQIEYYNLYQAALGRTYSDYLIGMNGSSVINIKFDKRISVGRVQTVTLRMIVDLENEINNFISKPFWTVSAETNKRFFGKYYNEDLTNNHFDSLESAQNLVNKVGLGKAKVSKMLISERKEKASKLFNLSDLQVEMNRRYHLSAQTVLNACQSLYEEYGLTTYPRTSENRISEELARKTSEIISALPNLFLKQKNEIEENEWEINSSCIAKKDIGSHEALTPTTKRVTSEIIESLPDITRKVYIAIVERFLSNFYPNATYTIQEIEFTRNNEIFKNKIESIKDYGFYKAYIKLPDFEQKEFIDISEGDEIEITDFKIDEGKTTPPSRFTEGTLIKTMTNPSKYVEGTDDKKFLKEIQGIGTEATRAQILETLKKRNLIEIVKSTIYPTEEGKELIELIPSEKLKSIPLTISMEQDLKQIQNGSLKLNEYLKTVNDFCLEFVNEIKSSTFVSSQTNTTNNGGQTMEEFCKCPICKSSIVENKFGYSCSNKECNVMIFYNGLEKLGKKKIGKTEARELLTKGKTSKKSKGFVSAKTGKDYEAFITYSYQPEEKFPNKISISFE